MSRDVCALSHGAPAQHGRLPPAERDGDGNPVASVGATYTLVCDWSPVDSATRLTNRSPTLHGLRLYRQQAGVYTGDSSRWIFECLQIAQKPLDSNG